MQLRALSLSIMTSDRENCNAGCQFCISRTTPGDVIDPREPKHCSEARLQVALGYAKALGATHGILTGKADPTQEKPEYLCGLVRSVRQHLPLCDMHTNGFLLHPGKNREHLLAGLVDAGLTMVTLSIASFDEDGNRELMGIRQSAAELIPLARELGLMVRCSLVVCKGGASNTDEVLAYVRQAGELGAQSVVVREVWRPEVLTPVNERVYAWNHENAIEIQPIEDDIADIAETKGNPHSLHKLYTLPWGRKVFAFGEGTFRDPSHAVQVVVSTSGDNFRGGTYQTLVLRPDGNVYGGWESKGSILA